MNGWMIDKLRQLLEFPFAGRGLTERQQEIARLAAIGHTTDEIAAKLKLSRAGAGSHMRDIKTKTGMGKAALTKDLFKRIEKVLN